MVLEKGATNPESNEVVESSRKELQELKTVVIANEGKDKLSLKEEDGKIKIDKRTISFEGLFLQDGNGNEKKIAKINNFYVKKTKDGLEVYSNGEQLPRLKLNNNGTVEGRSNPNDNKFDINLDGYGTIFESLKVELTNNYDKYRTPEKKMDFVGRGFSIEQGGKKFSVNAGNIYISGLKLYNSQSKKWENVQNITNMYVKRDSENNLTIYSSGEENPKMVLKPNGIVKGVLPGNGDNLNYGAKDDTVLRRTIWGELNNKYNTYRHEDVASASEPVLITYTTKEEPKRVNRSSISHRSVDVEYEENDFSENFGENLGESYDDIIPSGVMKNSISQGEYKMLSYNTYAQANGLDMYKYNIKGTNNSFDRIGAGYSKINNNKYEINTGFMIDFSTKKLYVKNMGMNEYSDSNCVRWRDRVFDFSDITINNNSITIKGKDVTHTIKKTGYETNSNLKREVSLRPRRLFYSMVMENKEKFT